MNAPKVGHGKADAPAHLPRSRAELLVVHRELRRRRDAAPLGSHERAEAMAEIGRVEVEVARLERAMDPPLV